MIPPLVPVAGSVSLEDELRFFMHAGYDRLPMDLDDMVFVARRDVPADGSLRLFSGEPENPAFSWPCYVRRTSKHLAN
jgi:hypothetical protein